MDELPLIAIQWLALATGAVSVVSALIGLSKRRKQNADDTQRIVDEVHSDLARLQRRKTTLTPEQRARIEAELDKLIATENETQRSSG